MNVATKAVDWLVNPPRISDPERLRAAVSGKTVLVTGASYGLGHATAIKLAAAGATVLAVARSADELNKLAESITARGEHAVALPADLTDGAAVASLAERILEAHGPPDIVVSNAGKSIRRPLDQQYGRLHDFD